MAPDSELSRHRHSSTCLIHVGEHPFGVYQRQPLGNQVARGKELLAFLQGIQPEYLYIVGDFFDAWVLTTRWYWPVEYTRIVDRVAELARQGTRVRITPGNHDSFLRGPLPSLPEFEIADEFVHETADGRRFVVTHGDLFDGIERGFRWLSKVGSFGYSLLIDVNILLNWILRRFGLRPRYFCFWLKRASKRMLGAYGRFQRKLIQYAVDKRVDGIICGHLHKPLIVERADITYINTGDWLENASALIEDGDGRLTLINHGLKNLKKGTQLFSRTRLTGQARECQDHRL